MALIFDSEFMKKDAFVDVLYNIGDFGVLYFGRILNLSPEESLIELGPCIEIEGSKGEMPAYNTWARRTLMGLIEKAGDLEWSAFDDIVNLDRLHGLIHPRKILSVDSKTKNGLVSISGVNISKEELEDYIFPPSSSEDVKREFLEKYGPK